MKDFKQSDWEKERWKKLEFIEGDYWELRHELNYVYKKIFASGKVEEFNGEYWIGKKTVNSIIRKLESRLDKEATIIIIPRKIRNDK